MVGITRWHKGKGWDGMVDGQGRKKKKQIIVCGGEGPRRDISFFCFFISSFEGNQLTSSTQSIGSWIIPRDEFDWLSFFLLFSNVYLVGGGLCETL